MRPKCIRVYRRLGMWMVEKNNLLYFEEESRDKALEFAAQLAFNEDVELIVNAGRMLKVYRVEADGHGHALKLRLQTFSKVSTTQQ